MAAAWRFWGTQRSTLATSFCRYGVSNRKTCSPDRSFYRHTQFGATPGVPSRKNSAFFFGDYQGTRQSQGVDTGLIPVPTFADRGGDLKDRADALTGEVSGPYLANLLRQKLGYGVAANEPYYTAGCSNSSQCVFPNAVIPQRAWAEPSK